MKWPQPTRIAPNSIKWLIPKYKWNAARVLLKEYARRRRLTHKMGFGWAETNTIKQIVARVVNKKPKPVATLQHKK